MFLFLILDKSEQCQYTGNIYSNLLHWLYYYIVCLRYDILIPLVALFSTPSHDPVWAEKIIKCDL